MHFNPTLVRLKQLPEPDKISKKVYFNPTLVRLKQRLAKAKVESQEIGRAHV